MRKSVCRYAPSTDLRSAVSTYPRCVDDFDKLFYIRVYKESLSWIPTHRGYVDTDCHTASTYILFSVDSWAIAIVLVSKRLGYGLDTLGYGFLRMYHNVIQCSMSTVFMNRRKYAQNRDD